MKFGWLLKLAFKICLNAREKRDLWMALRESEVRFYKRFQETDEVWIKNMYSGVWKIARNLADLLRED